MHGHINRTAPILNRRQVTVGTLAAGAMLALPGFGRFASARQAADLASLGLPTLDVAVSAAGYEGIPESLPAGRYLLTLSVGSDLETGEAAFVQPPAGTSAADFLGGIGVSVGDDAASPAASDDSAEASPAAEEGEGEEGGNFALPDYIYRATFAGGAGGTGGATYTTVIDLNEGEWFAWGDTPDSPVPPVIFNVTGAFPESPADPGADVQISLFEFDISAEGALTAGEHIVQLTNIGAQPHFLDMFKVTDGTTNDDLTALINADMTGTPVPEGGLNFEADFSDEFITQTQSIGVSTWFKYTFKPGTYAVMCWFPNAGTGAPHAMLGMHDVIEFTA